MRCYARHKTCERVFLLVYETASSLSIFFVGLCCCLTIDTDFFGCMWCECHFCFTCYHAHIICFVCFFFFFQWRLFQFRSTLHTVVYCTPTVILCCTGGIPEHRILYCSWFGEILKERQSTVWHYVIIVGVCYSLLGLFGMVERHFRHCEEKFRLPSFPRHHAIDKGR